MFSGIVEEAAPIVALKRDNGNLHLTLKSSFTHELKIDKASLTTACASRS